MDPGTFKNGAAVTVPRSGGAKGNLIAAALGAVLARPEAKLELLQGVTSDVLQRARLLCDGGRCRIECLRDQRDFHIEVEVGGAKHSARCVLAGGHSNVERIEKDGQAVFLADSDRSAADPLAYRRTLRKMSMAEVLALVETLDDDDRAYLRRGVEMNLAMSEWGFEVGGTAYQLRQILRDGFVADDMFYRTKLRVASAVDARMAGMSQAVMTSGGSGNQGIVAILTPYIVGRESGIDADHILQSVAVAHLVNAYVKCYVGELSVICGCGMAAGIASAAAIVYQQAGIDMRRIALAVGNVIGDLGGLICDGAKPGSRHEGHYRGGYRHPLRAHGPERLRPQRRRRAGRPHGRRFAGKPRPHQPGRHVPGRPDDAPHPSGKDRRQRQGVKGRCAAASFASIILGGHHLPKRFTNRAASFHCGCREESFRAAVRLCWVLAR